MSISLCMIVKNEERFLADFIARHRGFFDQWVIVDTGSTDGTRTIIADAGLPAYSFQWCNDFAAARNYALSLCEGDWVAAFDADETLDPAGQLQVKHALTNEKIDGLSVRIKNYVQEDEDFAKRRDHLVGYTPPDGSFQSLFGGDVDFGYVDTQLMRFFRNGMRFHWISPIHEVLTCDGEPRIAFLKGVSLHHRGSLNLEGKREQKAFLYSQISKSMHRDLKVCDDPKILFEAARSVENIQEKLEMLGRANKLAPQDIYILKEMANSYMESENVEEALACCQRMVEVDPTNLEPYLALAHCYWSQNRPNEAIAVLRREYARFREKPMYHYTLATLTLQAGDYVAARSYAKRAYDLAPKSKTIAALHERISKIGE